MVLCGRGKVDIEAKHMGEFLKKSCDRSLNALNQNEEDSG